MGPYLIGKFFNLKSGENTSTPFYKEIMSQEEVESHAGYAITLGNITYENIGGILHPIKRNPDAGRNLIMIGYVLANKIASEQDLPTTID